MRNILAILLIFITVCSSLSQTVRFRHVIDDTLSNMMMNVFDVDTGYVLVGGTSVNFASSIAVEYIDTLGFHVWKKVIHNPDHDYFTYKNAVIKTTDGGYAMAGGRINYPAGLRGPMLTKFDAHFDTLWTKYYIQDSLFVTAYGIVQSTDGGFGIIGKKRESDDDCQMLFIKTDNMGNYQWHRLYGDSGTEGGNSIVNSQDGGYVLGGDTWSYGTSQKWYVVKTDSLGNLVWYKVLGSSQFDNGGVNGIVTTQDSCFVLTGGKAVGIINDHEVYNGMIVKIPMYGPVIWQKEYIEKRKCEDWNPDTVYCMFTYPIELSDGSLACLAWTKPYQDMFVSKLYRFDLDGDTLYTRTYDVQHNPYWDDEYLEALKQTPDGGFIIGGWGKFYLFSPSQRMCAVKTDCNGFDSLALAAFTDSVAEYTVFFYNRSRYADSCIWNFGDGSPLLYASVCDTVIHTYGDTGNYSVSLTAYSSCDFSEADTAVIPLDISTNGINIYEAGNNPYIRLYPNPCNGRFHLDYRLTPGSNGSLIISTLQGREIAIYRLNGKAGHAFINTVNMGVGMYIYTIYESERLVEKGKLIILK